MLCGLRKHAGEEHAGQGVVEYAGALVIAIVLMVTVITTLPPNLYAFFVDMQEQVLSYLVDQVSNI